MPNWLAGVLGGVWISGGRYGSYNVPFIPMTAFLLIGAWLWLNVDPAQALIPGPRAQMLVYPWLSLGASLRGRDEPEAEAEPQQGCRVQTQNCRETERSESGHQKTRKKFSAFLIGLSANWRDAFERMLFARRQVLVIRMK